MSHLCSIHQSTHSFSVLLIDFDFGLLAERRKLPLVPMQNGYWISSVSDCKWLNCGKVFFKRPVSKCLEGERHPHQKPPQSLLRCWRLHLTDSLPARSLRARWQASSEPLLAAWHPKDALLLCTFDHLPPVLHRINFGRYLQTQITYIKHREKKTNQASIKG